jgi:aspartate aminotransferase-like enzyme
VPQSHDFVWLAAGGGLGQCAISNVAAAERLQDFKDTMAHVVSSTRKLRDKVQKGAEARGLTLENVSEMLSTEMANVLAELKAEFPSPDDADHHKQRVEMVSRGLSKTEESVVRVSMQCGVSEADARIHFQNIKPHIQNVIVVVGECIHEHVRW